MFYALCFCALWSETRSGYFCEQKTASATQPQPCPIGTFFDSEAATSAQSCKRCPNADDCKNAGKSAPDCEPTVFRPSTFWCYDIKNQAAIIAGSLVSVISFLYGVLVFYNANKLNQQRLHQLRVDLKHLTLPIRVLAPVFIADKLIRLHKLRHPIVFKNLWMALPFDENMDKDIEDLIDARIARHIADLENRGEPLNLSTLSHVIRSSQAIKKKIYDQPPPIAHAGDCLLYTSPSPRD